MSKEIARIFQAAEAAKQQEEYAVANAAFAVLVGHFLPDLTVELETTDWVGDYPEEGYYDLFVLRYEDEYLCIPAPLLAGWVILLLMKRAEIVQRLNHNREVLSDEHVSAETLWEQLANASGFTREVIDKAVRETLISED